MTRHNYFTKICCCLNVFYIVFVTELLPEISLIVWKLTLDIVLETVFYHRIAIACYDCRINSLMEIGLGAEKFLVVDVRERKTRFI